MQKSPGPGPVAAPTFRESVLGSMIGIFGCFFVAMIALFCIGVMWLAVFGMRVGGLF